jgi:hypothetical protein
MTIANITELLPTGTVRQAWHMTQRCTPSSPRAKSWHLAPAIAVARVNKPENVVSRSTSVTIRWTLTVTLYSTPGNIGASFSGWTV